ncbi:hypothetical protein [Emticicia fontis]
MKIRAVILLISGAFLCNACIGPKACLYYVSFTNKSSEPVQFGWGKRTAGKVKMVEVKGENTIDFSFWTDELPMGSFPQDGDSIIVVLANGKRIIDVKQCEILNGDINCKQDSRSFFNPKAYSRYQSSMLNRSCGGVEYVFTDNDAMRAR